MSEPDQGALAFSVDTPSADEGHEAIRVAVVQAIQDLVDTAASLETTTGAAELLQMIVGFFQSNIDSLLGADAVLSDRSDALEARILALEEASAPPTEEVPI